ncbi:MAG: hypothetical protein Phog2KO_08360 [Phototrophicaceae bacterium]
MPDEEQNFHGEKNQNAYNVLRKLQEHVRSNIPAIVAQRAMSSFSLQQEPAPEEANDVVFVVVYPQNPFVGEPEVRRMNAKDIQGGLINSRVQIQDSRGVLALPNDEGHYLYWAGTPEFDQVNAFYYTTFTLRMYERYAHRQIPWSFPSARIKVDPHVGDLANAFYNEQEQLLGFHTFINKNGEQHSTAQSADIVTHEVAHAILDGLRDLYNESFGLGSRAFHESFGDISAILVALHDDSLIRRLLEWTDGDLKMSNFISEVAEHLTDELIQSPYFEEHTIYLRNAFNMLEDTPFDQLAYSPENPEIDLARQEHNYSRLFTGAFYDILVGVYERFLENNQHAFVALYRARDVVGHLLIMAIEAGPVGELNFSDMAKSFITADEILYNGKYNAILRNVFNKRVILTKALADIHREEIKNLPDVRLPDTLNNALSAAMFLEEEILPALNIKPSGDLMPLSTYRNSEGFAFISYFNSRTVLLEGKQFKAYDGVEVDTFGGLTLVFDKHNRLKSVCYRPVTDIDVAQLKVVVKELIEHDKIVEDFYPLNSKFSDTPDGLIIAGKPMDKPEGNKLVKYPVIFDEIPDFMSNLKVYLNRWIDKSDS